MEIIALITFILLAFSTICFTYVLYQLRQMQKHLREAIKICEDAVTSLRAGRG